MSQAKETIAKLHNKIELMEADWWVLTKLKAVSRSKMRHKKEAENGRYKWWKDTCCLLLFSMSQLFAHSEKRAPFKASLYFEMPAAVVGNGVRDRILMSGVSREYWWVWGIMNVKQILVALFLATDYSFQVSKRRINETIARLNFPFVLPRQPPTIM